MNIQRKVDALRRNGATDEEVIEWLVAELEDVAGQFRAAREEVELAARLAGRSADE